MGKMSGAGSCREKAENCSVHRERDAALPAVTQSTHTEISFGDAATHSGCCHPPRLLVLTPTRTRLCVKMGRLSSDALDRILVTKLKLVL